MKSETIKAIENVLNSCVSRALKRIKKEKTLKPFHELLLTKELLLASAFERSFSTSFGQGPIEEISKLIAIDSGAECTRQKEIQAEINKGATDEISRLLNALRDGSSKPNWNRELKRVCSFKKGDYVTQRLIFDLWIKRDGVENFFSIKTVKPNIDQTEIAKKDMLLLKAHDPKLNTYFSLYYNPGGEKREDYNWSIPSKIFDMKTDNCVLIGKEYWDFIGGEGTYVELLSVFESVGKKVKNELKVLSK